jgi:hypothetical protein
MGGNVSERKRHANRLNARKSTGPRTEEGKKKSRWNALKHGLTGKSILVPGHENSKEFTKLLKAYMRTFRPKGAFEKAVVQELAESHVMAQRGSRLERNAFRQVADDAKEEVLDEELMTEAEAREHDFLKLPMSDTIELIMRYQSQKRRERDQRLKILYEAQRLRKKIKKK